MRWNLKEAVSKSLVRRTEITYKASDISVTMDVYNHVNDDRIQNELEKLESMMAV